MQFPTLFYYFCRRKSKKDLNTTFLNYLPKEKMEIINNYMTPAIEVIELEMEPALCSSTETFNSQTDYDGEWA